MQIGSRQRFGAGVRVRFHADLPASVHTQQDQIRLHWRNQPFSATRGNCWQCTCTTEPDPRRFGAELSIDMPGAAVRDCSDRNGRSQSGCRDGKLSGRAVRLTARNRTRACSGSGLCAGSFRPQDDLTGQDRPVTSMAAQTVARQAAHRIATAHLQRRHRAIRVVRPQPQRPPQNNASQLSIGASSATAANHGASPAGRCLGHTNPTSVALSHRDPTTGQSQGGAVRRMRNRVSAL